MKLDSCIFCSPSSAMTDMVIAENELFFSKWDANPASKGHALVIPRRHMLSFFDMTSDELTAFYAIASDVKRQIDNKYKPDGLNIGVNDGEAAGRTVHHLHIHLIPRYLGDVSNPRGGVRHVIPGKGDY